eukprot:1875451-Amphidinium_carterae.1
MPIALVACGMHTVHFSDFPFWLTLARTWLLVSPRPLRMREKLRLQWELLPATGPTGYETDLVQELIRRGGDPEQDLPQWMAGATPLAISEILSAHSS